MLPIDLSGKRAFIAGVADDGGFGFAIAKALAEAGAIGLRRHLAAGAGHLPQDCWSGARWTSRCVLSDGRKLAFEKIYPLDAEYDTLADVPAEVRENKRYKEHGDFTIEGLAASLRRDFGDQGARHRGAQPGQRARGEEAAARDQPRAGYLTAVGVSAYSNVSLVQRLGPMMRPGGSFLSLTYMAGERVVPGYGGGMSSAKAALESDTRMLAFEAGRSWGVRVNAISRRPLGVARRHRDRLHRHDDRLLQGELAAAPPARGAARWAPPPRSSPARWPRHHRHAVYVDKGYHAMGMAVSAAGIEPPAAS